MRRLTMPFEQLLALKSHSAVGTGESALRIGWGAGTGFHAVITLMCGLKVPFQCASTGKGTAAFRAIKKTIFHMSVRSHPFR